MYRLSSELEVLLIHPGGPFFKNKDLGSWSIPKGEPAEGEDAVKTAIREFKEELGYEPVGEMLPLGQITQKGGKTVSAWAVQGDLDTGKIKSNTFFMEWPPKSGKMTEFPEADKAEWFTVDVAKLKINQAQVALINELVSLLKTRSTNL